MLAVENILVVLVLVQLYAFVDAGLGFLLVNVMQFPSFYASHAKIKVV